jgi:hypothetical protein
MSGFRGQKREFATWTMQVNHFIQPQAVSNNESAIP